MENRRRTRIINTSRVIRELWIARKVSRVDIARTLGLNKSTVTSIVDDLLERKLVVEAAEGQASPKGGRRPVKLSLNNEFGYVLGFELRPESFTVLAVDMTGDILFTKSEDKGFQAEGFKTDFLTLCEKIIEELAWVPTPLMGIGVGISGIVNSDDRIIKGSIPLEFRECFDFYEEIASYFHVPVFIENDANCCAWGEMVFHRTRYLKNYLFVLIEIWRYGKLDKDLKQPAIGIGIGLNGKIYHGTGYSAGEFRSVFNDGKGPLQISSVEDPENRGYFEENPEMLEAFIRELSKNLAMIVNTLNLDQVFIGGDVEVFRHLIQPILREEIDINWAYSNDVSCEIRFSSMGRMSVAYGAAGLVLDKLFIDLESLDDPDNLRKTGFFLLQDEFGDHPMKEWK